MRVVISGGTGFIGQQLVAALASRDNEVVVLTRKDRADTSGTGVTYTAWNPEDASAAGDWSRVLDGADAVVNLAGASIGDRRWTPAYKKELIDSRIQATRALGRAMAAADRPPAVMISASGKDYYGPRGPEPVDESSERGSGFLADLTAEWEQAAAEAAAAAGARLVVLRLAVVLGEGGALPQMLLPFKFFAGGPLGSGRQYYPWIHVQDVVDMIMWAIHQPNVEGPLNAAAPQSLPNREFMAAIGKVLRRPAFVPAPAPALRLVLGAERADALLLGGQNIVPRRALDLGYTFRFSDLETALRDVLNG